MVPLKLEFDIYDYLGPVAVALAFAVSLFIISVFILNFFFVTKYDDPTVIEKIGSKLNLRLGPHSIESVLDHQNRYQRNFKHNLTTNDKQKSVSTETIEAEVQWE